MEEQKQEEKSHDADTDKPAKQKDEQSLDEKDLEQVSGGVTASRQSDAQKSVASDN